MKWIDVKEAIPCDYDGPLLIYNNGAVYIAFGLDRDCDTNNTTVEEFYPEGIDGFNGEGYTHWMYLKDIPTPSHLNVAPIGICFPGLKKEVILNFYIKDTE